MTERQDDTSELLGRFQAGDQQALAELFTRHRPRLWHMVNVRLDPRLAGRVDADDVLQEAFLDASDRMQHYIDEHSGSLFVWLRLIVSQTLTLFMTPVIFVEIERLSAAIKSRLPKRRPRMAVS